MGSLPQLSIIKGPLNEYPVKPLHKIFEENLPLCQDEIALSFIKSVNSTPLEISYATLNERSSRIADFIKTEVDTYKLKPNLDGDWIVAVCMEPTEVLITVLLAIWKAGAAYLPLDPTFPKDRITHIINESQPILIICDDSVDKDQFESTIAITAEVCLSNENNFSNLPIKSNSSDLAIVLYTSGSTGISKGVRLPHPAILNRLHWQWNRFPYSADEKAGCFKTALTFVDSISEIWGPLLSGMRVIIIPKSITKNPEELIEILEENSIERLVLVPTLLKTILIYLGMHGKSKKLNCLRSWICSGETLSVELVNEFNDYFQEGEQTLYNFYGSTEVMGDVTYFVSEGKKQLETLQKVPIGMPIDNTIIYLLDSDFRPVKNGEIGEIFVSGRNLAAGYVNGRDPDKFLKNPLSMDSNYSRIYRTGDFGVLYKDMILYEGRTDSQIKIRGHRVDLSEVERALSTIEIIDKAVVLCHNPGVLDQALLAFITINNSEHNDHIEDYIEATLEKKIASYMIPHIIVLESIPLLVNGKVDRQYLLKLYTNLHSKGDNSEDNIFIDFSHVDNVRAARDLFDTIRETIGKLKRSTISVNSNFYDLGGNSLNSIYAVTRLQEKGYFISITDFIGAKNLNEILKKISAANKIQLENDTDMYLKMVAKPLSPDDKKTTIDIITKSFYEKADLERWLKDDIHPMDYADIIEQIWEVLLDKDLSFLVKDENDKILGISLNFDGRDEPDVVTKSKLLVIFEFLETLEGPIRDKKLPPGLNQVLHSFMMGTIPELNAQENIAVINFMEKEVLALAIRRNFAGILTTNTNPLTQQLGTSVYNYDILLDYQVNEYVHKDGTRPFKQAPDTQRAIVQWKEV